MTDQASMPIGWFEWVMGIFGLILSGAGGVVWARQNRLDDKIETTLGKVDAMDGKMADHKLEDERQFAKKDDMRHLYEVISRELSELKENQTRNLSDLKENQERNLHRVLDKLDKLDKLGK